VIEELDLDTAIKLSQAISGEIVREKVIDTLMRTAVEHAGAERGLLILPQGVDPRIEAEAKAEKSPGSETVTVDLRQASVTAADLPESLFHHVVRTQESVILDDASAQNPFSSDDYIRQNHTRSVVCLPLVRQAKLIGVLYLENNLAPHVFTPARIGVLKLLASQAAISLENADLYSDLQRSEAAIRASEKNLRLIIDTIPGFVCTLNAEGEVELLNRQVLEYFGKTTEELKNWIMSDAVHPDDLPRVIDAWRRSVETGQPYSLEFRQRRADGVYRWFQSRALPARDTEGRVTGWYMLLTDIDDQKSAEDAIRSNEQSLRLIVDSIPGFVSTANAAGEIELINRQLLEYFGKTTEELSDWATSGVIHPDDVPRMIDSWRRAIETGQPLDLEHRGRGADGVYRWYHLRWRPQRDAEGRIVRWYNLGTDIDERKKAEEKLQRSEAFLAQAQSISHTGSFGWRVCTGEIFWSDETFRIFQYDPTTKPSVALVLQRTHPDDAAFVKQSIERASQDGNDFDFEHRLLMPHGSIKHLRVVGHAERDQSDELEFVGAVIDVTAAKEAEERIRQDERELRITIETIPALVSSTLSDGSLDFISQGWLDYVGCSREEMLGEGWKPTIHPEDLDRVLNNWQVALAAGEPLEMEARFRRADGKYRWFLVRAAPLRDEKGNIVKWYATIFDIGDRKQAEEKLRRSEAYLAEAQRLTHTGSWVQNVATGERTHSSEEFCRLYGFDPERGVPSDQEFRQRIHRDDVDRVVEVYERAVRERTDFEMDYRIVLPDGTIKFLHAIGHPVFNAAGDLVEYIGINLDVTERKLAEETLRRSEAYLAEAQRLTHTASWARKVATEEITHSSEEHARLYGFDPKKEAPSFEAMYQRVHPEDRDSAFETFDRAVGERTDFEVDFRTVLPDNTIKYLHAIGHPVFNAGGDLVEYMGTVMDVTERKRAEEALQKAQAELAHVTRVATLGEMTASISHEINQPLGAMVNNANACLRWLAASKLEEARQSAMLIAADGYRAGEIIARIRALAQKAPPRKDWLNINEAIHEVIALARSELQGNHVSLKTRLGRDVPPILGDRIQLQQVMLNLMMNAIEAMRGVDESVPRELWVDSEKVESTNVLIAVRDSGPGVDAESLDRLFDTFYTTKPEGLGMGLPISRSIIEAHGGRLWATANASHAGAVFQFTLPITERAS
jgi:PAS domain S-box-containing protein